MTIKQLISVVVAVGSAWLGGSLGATALERANAAPLTGSSHTSTSTSRAPELVGRTSR